MQNSDKIVEKALDMMAARTASNDLLTFLMREFSEFSTADIVVILPPIVLALGVTSVATAALLFVVLEIIADQTLDIDDLPDGVVNALNTVNETVSTATDLVDRTRELVEGQGGEIAATESDRVREISDHANDIRRNLNEILDRLPEEGIVIRNLEIDEFRTIAIDFLEAFEQLMNIL